MTENTTKGESDGFSSFLTDSEKVFDVRRLFKNNIKTVKSTKRQKCVYLNKQAGVSVCCKRSHALNTYTSLRARKCSRQAASASLEYASFSLYFSPWTGHFGRGLG